MFAASTSVLLAILLQGAAHGSTAPWQLQITKLIL
jgi:hypothetical protein